jgi:hypothetical protein
MIYASGSLKFDFDLRADAVTRNRRCRAPAATAPHKDTPPNGRSQTAILLSGKALFAPVFSVLLACRPLHRPEIFMPAWPLAFRALSPRHRKTHKATEENRFLSEG